MSEQNSRSAPVVDSLGRIGEGHAAAKQGGAGAPILTGDGNGVSIPAPPPPPASGNVDPRVIRDQIRAQQRQLRDARVQSTKARLSRVHPRYFIYTGVVVALGLGAVACRSYQADQRDTALALAQLANGGRQQEVAPPSTVITQGIPNPLDALPLSNQAKWNIGAGGDGVLPPARSSVVISELLKSVDLCNVWVGLNDRANVVVAFEPAPGFSPMLTADQCATPTVVEVPADPVPTTVAQ